MVNTIKMCTATKLGICVFRCQFVASRIGISFIHKKKKNRDILASISNCELKLLVSTKYCHVGINIVYL